jgi:hypothetical protein
VTVFWLAGTIFAVLALMILVAGQGGMTYGFQ